MTQRRSEEAMREGKERVNQSKHDRVLATIQGMGRTGDPGLDNKSEIARRAGVHRNYVSERFSEAINLAKAEAAKRFVAGADQGAGLTIASLRAERESARQEAVNLRREVAALKERLAHVLGEEVTAEHPSADLRPGAVADREEHDRALARVVELELELRSAQEDLDAARALNRRLMREANAAVPGTS